MSPRSGLLIVLGFTLWRVVTLNFDATDLFVDEAQYWFWSQNLDLGYYSKPPMIAWVIRAMTELSGSNAIYWIRLLGPLIHMAAALVLMKTAKRFVGPEIEGWTGATYITLPGVALSSVFFSTDVILLFFIAIALLAYFGLTQRRSVGLALVMGLSVGLAFLTKYAVLFVVPGGALALLLIPAARIAIRDCIIAVAVAAVVALPNLWWNLQHDNTTVRHTQDIAHWSELGINVRRGLEFFSAQFGVVGPIIFFAMLWAVYRMVKGRSDDREKILVWLSMPVVVLITLQATVAKAYANWAVTAYVAGTILAVWLLYRMWPKGLRLSLTINGIASLLFPLATIFPHQLLLPNGDELMKRYLGRAEVSREAAALAAQLRHRHHRHRQSRHGRRSLLYAPRCVLQDLCASARGPSGELLRAGIRSACRHQRQGAFPDGRGLHLRHRDARGAEELAADGRQLQGQDAFHLQGLGHLPGTLSRFSLGWIRQAKAGARPFDLHEFDAALLEGEAELRLRRAVDVVVLKPS